MLLVKPAGTGYDGVQEGRFASFLSYGLAGDPAEPGAITDWTVELVDTEYRITISALPAAGDAVYPGDGAGVILDIEWQADDGDGASLDATTTGSWLVAPVDPTSIGVRVRATLGYGPWSEIAIAEDGEPIPPPDEGGDQINLLLEDGGNRLNESGGLMLLEEDT
jgi:hypothetical protein